MVQKTDKFLGATLLRSDLLAQPCQGQQILNRFLLEHGTLRRTKSCDRSAPLIFEVCVRRVPLRLRDAAGAQVFPEA